MNCQFKLNGKTYRTDQQTDKILTAMKKKIAAETGAPARAEYRGIFLGMVGIGLKVGRIVEYTPPQEPEADPDPDDDIITNADRIEKIKQVIKMFYDEDPDGAQVDLLTDLRHYVDQRHYANPELHDDWDAIERMSLNHFNEERDRETPKADPLTGHYGWTITRDLQAEQEENPAPRGTHSNAAGLVGPCTCKLTHEEIVKRPGVFFRLLDDDGNIYYVGYACGTDADQRMDPLDGFGMPNAGCTSMQTRDALCQTDWKTL